MVRVSELRTVEKKRLRRKERAIKQWQRRLSRRKREAAQELRPSGIVNGFRQHSAGKSLCIQIFDGDHTKLVDDLTTQFLLKVRSLVEVLACALWNSTSG